MSNAYYETLQEIGSSGIQLSFQSKPGGYHPLHWHQELELFYPLYGDADVTIMDKRYHLSKKHLIAVESCQVHGYYYSDLTANFLCIHIQKEKMQQYLPDIELYQIQCLPGAITEENAARFDEICGMMETLNQLHFASVPVFEMEAKGIILQVLARLLRYFSYKEAPDLAAANVLTTERIRQIIAYVNENFRDPISLQDISEQIGLGKEAFCRFFKKNMGISFLNYLNKVRMAHFYQDLIGTDLPITELMEKNGITNQKLFNSSFKELYGRTPSSIRKSS